VKHAFAAVEICELIGYLDIILDKLSTFGESINSILACSCLLIKYINPREGIRTDSSGSNCIIYSITGNTA